MFLKAVDDDFSFKSHTQISHVENTSLHTIKCLGGWKLTHSPRGGQLLDDAGHRLITLEQTNLSKTRVLGPPPLFQIYHQTK